MKYVLKFIKFYFSLFFIIYLYAPLANANHSVFLDIDEKWLNAIASGNKTVEGRIGSLTKGKFAFLTKGDFLVFKSKAKSLKVQVMAIRHYPNLQQYLINEGLRNTLPGIATLKEAMFVYHTYYTPEQIKKAGGMLAIECHPLPPSATKQSI